MGSRNESKAEKERQKQIQDKCLTVLTQLLRDDDNKYCVDCDAKGPRWASWNLGVFLCIRCAGIHRNLGVHISRVKSVNLDSWTPEQVVSLQQMGNSRARAVYEATLPDTWRRPQTDSSLETFIRAKYQHKRYIAKEWVPPPIPKVDWEKELDEETERQKKKKKEKQQQQSNTPLAPVKKPDIRVPALPKPASSPKATRAAAPSTTLPTDEPSKSSADDLLGLSVTSNTSNDNANADDVFSSFLSAPAAPAPAPITVSEPVLKVDDARSRTAEEDSFFNQPAATSNDGGDSKKALSKDSILALYSSQTASAPQPAMFHAPGMYPSNQGIGFPPVASNAGFPATMGFPASVPNAGFPGAFPIQNSGFLPQMGGYPPMGVPSQFLNGVQPGTGPNPFFGMSSNMAIPQAFPMQHGSQTRTSHDLLGDFSVPPTVSLPQQMSGLSLSGSNMVSGLAGGLPGTTPSPFAPVNNGINPPLGQTFTTHLWQ